MQQHHGYNIDTLENMYPFERDIYVGLLKNHLIKQREQQPK